jgi:hypothetical protein
MSSRIPANLIRRTIGYYYLAAFCPPTYLGQFRQHSLILRANLARAAGMQEAPFFGAAVPEVSWRIVAFHQQTREPDRKLVQQLVQVCLASVSSPQALAAFQACMGEVAALPGRAKPTNRLHRRKGCALCAAPCKYGFFTLVSDPQFRVLRQLLEQPDASGSRDVVHILWTYTTSHLWQTLGARQGFVSADHLGNLAYCLLLLATARSRRPMPEPQLRAFQERNQARIRSWKGIERGAERS